MQAQLQGHGCARFLLALGESRLCSCCIWKGWAHHSSFQIIGCIQLVALLLQLLRFTKSLHQQHCSLDSVLP